MPISIIDNFDVNAPKNIDGRLGPYDTTASAKTAIDETTQRYLGLTVVVTGSGNLEEYWFQDGTTDSDLVLKPSGGGGGDGTDIAFTYYVSPSGSDITGEVGNWHKPFQTISGSVQQAVADATAGGYSTTSSVIYVNPGQYVEQALAYNGNFYFAVGAKLSPPVQAYADAVPFFSVGSNGVDEVKIFGNAEFIVQATTDADANSKILYATGTGSAYLECYKIDVEDAYSIWAQDDATVLMQGKEISYPASSGYMVSARDNSNVTLNFDKIFFNGTGAFTYMWYCRQGSTSNWTGKMIVNAKEVTQVDGYGLLLLNASGSENYMNVDNFILSGSTTAAIATNGTDGDAFVSWKGNISNYNIPLFAHFAPGSGRNQFILDGTMKAFMSTNTPITINGGANDEMTLDLWIESSGSNNVISLNNGTAYLNRSLYNTQNGGNGVNVTGGTLEIDTYKIVTTGSGYSISGTSQDVIINNTLSSNVSASPGINLIGPGTYMSDTTGQLINNDVKITGSLYQSGSFAYFQPDEFTVDALGDSVFSIGQLGTQDIKLGTSTTSTEVRGPLTASIISASGALISSELTASGLNYPNADGTDGQVLTTDGLGNISFGHGEKLHLQVRNDDSVDITAGTPVYSTGEIGGSERIKVRIASSSNAATMPAIGVVETTLTTTGGTQDGFAIINGVYNENVTPVSGTPALGDNVYVHADGGLTTVKPTGSNLIQNIGIILKTNGTIIQGMKVSSIDRTNDVPNITEGYFWVGNSDSVATATPTSSLISDPKYLVYQTGSGTDSIRPSNGAGNTVTGNCSVVSGGDLNSVTGNRSFIGGGTGHTVSSNSGTIGGGYQNNICSNAGGGTIAGGDTNKVCNNNTTVAGGRINCALVQGATVGGGEQNSNCSDHGVISGGERNCITNVAHSTIGGGIDNCVTGTCSVVGGGQLNEGSGPHDFIGGGCNNQTAGTGASSFNSILGGELNEILDELGNSTSHSTIGGGECNKIDADHAVIGGGCKNYIGGVALNPEASTIGGGHNNFISSSASTIAGGEGNHINEQSECSFIGGGHQNIISLLANTNTIGGGTQNNIAEGACCGGILGGQRNKLQHDKSFIIGSELTSSAACTTFMNNAIIEGNISASGHLSASYLYTPEGNESSISASYAVTASHALNVPGGNTQVDTYMYSWQAGTDETFFNDGNISLTYDETNDDIDLVFLTEPSGNGDLVCCTRVFTDGVTPSVDWIDITTQGATYQLAGLIPASSQVELYIYHVDHPIDTSYPRYKVTVAQDSDSGTTNNNAIVKVYTIK